jgi:hypothetical protein
MPVILATQETEIRRIMVQRQPRQIVQETLSRKTPSQKMAGAMAQGVSSEFKPQYHKKIKPDSWLGMVVHIGNPCSLGGGGRRIVTQGQLEQRWPGYPM